MGIRAVSRDLGSWGRTFSRCVIASRTHPPRTDPCSYALTSRPVSFAGLGFLAFYLAGKLHLFDRRGHTVWIILTLHRILTEGAQGKAWLALTPFAGATLVAISRTMDYRRECRPVFLYVVYPVNTLSTYKLTHPSSDHWQDVLTGSILGTVMTYFAYRQYYPPLHDPLAHRPYSPRIRREDEPWVEEGAGNGFNGEGNGYDRTAADSTEGEVLPTTQRYNAGYAGGYPPAAHVSAPRRDYEDPYGVSGGSGQHHASSSIHRGDTMKRPGPGPLEDVWRQGADDEDEDRTPRTRDLESGGMRDFESGGSGGHELGRMHSSDGTRPRGVLEDDGEAREVPVGVRG